VCVYIYTYVQSLMLQKETRYIKSTGVKTFEQDVQIFLILFKYHIFSFSAALQKIFTCFPGDKLSTIYLHLQIQEVYSPWFLMHRVSFWSISECLNLLLKKNELTAVRYSPHIARYEP